MEMEPASNNPAIVALEACLSQLQESALTQENAWKSLHRESEQNRQKMLKLHEEAREVQACIMELKALRLGAILFKGNHPGNE